MNYSFTFTTMKKRNRESISPPFPDKKETNHGTNGVELPGIKKSRLNVVVISSSEFQILFYNFPQYAILCLTPELNLQQPADPDGSPSRPITKDEEEVVEPLSALADMFPNNNKNGLDGELEKPKSYPSPEGESSRPACEGLICIYVISFFFLLCILSLVMLNFLIHQIMPLLKRKRTLSHFASQLLLRLRLSILRC